MGGCSSSRSNSGSNPEGSKPLLRAPRLPPNFSSPDSFEVSILFVHCDGYQYPWFIWATFLTFFLWLSTHAEHFPAPAQRALKQVTPRPISQPILTL